jgi:hypothetical protein
MNLKGILNDLKLGGLALLLSLNSCSSPKNVAEDYLDAIKSRNAEKLKMCCSHEILKNKTAIGWIMMTRAHYSDAFIKSYIPEEERRYKKDLENIVWIIHNNGGYHQVSLIKEEGKWKVYDIGRHYRD